MSKLHQASSKSAQLPCIEQNLGSIDYNTIIQKKYLIKAQGIAKELLRMSITPVVLHADLHYKNILLSSKEWIAIDPHGLIGDPAYELGAYVRNFIRLPCSSNELKHVINKKLSLCSYYTDLDIHRLQAWSYVNTVLAACWMAEDKQDYSFFLRVVDALDYRL